MAGGLDVSSAVIGETELAICAQPLIFRTSFHADEREALDWSVFLCLIMFLSSVPASYQFVILIAATIPTISFFLNRRRWKLLCVYSFLYFAACNIRVIIWTARLQHRYTAALCNVVVRRSSDCLLFRYPQTFDGDKDKQHKKLFQTPVLKIGASSPFSGCSVCTALGRI
jgi:hypothetical protein